MQACATNCWTQPTVLSMKVRSSARRAMHASMVPRVMALAVVLVVSAWIRENISLRNQNREYEL